MTTGIILGAAYMLWLYRRIAFGSAAGDDTRAMPDLSVREIAILRRSSSPCCGWAFTPRPSRTR